MLKDIEREIKKFGRVIVAYSGGVDSSLLAKLCFDVLGNDSIAVTVNDGSMPERELEQAKEIANWIGIKHYIINHEHDENYFKNSKDRCYYCKLSIFKRLYEFGRELGYTTLVDGTNRDELKGHRPGYKAIIEMGVKTPLIRYTKEEIREMAKSLGLPNWNKPSMACLSSRIPFGDEITHEKLKKIEKAEDILYSLGFRVVRVRYHGKIARIELSPDEISKAFELRDKIISGIKRVGFSYVCIDLEGYRTGSLAL